MEAKLDGLQNGAENEQLARGYLTFAIDGEGFGINLVNVIEIIGVQPVTHLPYVPDYIKGIINLRGRVIPVIDMRLKFHKESVPYTDRTCVVVVEVGELSVGLIVDYVSEVLSIQEEQIVAPPQQASGRQAQYISGIGQVNGEVVLLLDCEKLLEEDASLPEPKEQ